MAPAAKALEVVDQPSHALAQEGLKLAAVWEKKVVELFADPKAAAFKAHKFICKMEATFLEPVRSARRQFTLKATAYETQQKRLADAERLRLEALALRQDEERRLAEAVAAEDAGDPDMAEAILSQEPPRVVPVVVEPAVAEVAGVSTREVWSAEVTNIRELISYCASRPDWSHLLEPNMRELNGLARRLRVEFNVPGVKATHRLIKSVRTDADVPENSDEDWRPDGA